MRVQDTAFDVRPEQYRHDFVSQAMALDGPGAMARATDPTTSHQAADSITGEAREESERFVLDALRWGPLTDGMLVDAAAGKWSPSRIRTARKQLVEKGLVRDSGLTALTPSGRRSIEWEAVS